MTVGYLFSGVLTHLPVLAVLIAGLALVTSRKARLGPRSTMLARLGLAALVLGELLGAVWFIVFPQLIRSLDYRPSTYGMVTFGVGLVLSTLMAAGVGLLIAAVVTRAPGGGGPFEPSPYAFPTPGAPGSQPPGGPPPGYHGAP
ncbi:hypothetical protein AB0368_12625 [Actinoplanes sp. NPDC051475]|uniref:hypothetical protein n=1 Tax=Actinoplanes sp. NPDC051475 TaxID=3157225 RepID=UPI00345046F2